MRIYLDHNASTPLRDCARLAMIRCIEDCGHGNPASVHRAGQLARRMVENARERVATLIGVPARSVIFTSGGTEANNLAILGAAESTGRRRKIVSSAIEHSSLLAPLSHLEAHGFETVRVMPDCDGRLAPEQVVAAIDDQTALVTLGLANAETGALQQLSLVAEAAAGAGARFHVDAAQAAGRIALNAEELRCDLMTLSAHKIGGPAGAGALYVRSGVALEPQIIGGPQESGFRAGTHNLIGAVGFGAAAEETAQVIGEESAGVAALADVLRDRLNGAIPGLRFNGPQFERIRNTFNVTFPGVIGESLLIALDLEGVEVSMGSACAAGAVEPSHVLLAMGRSAGEARSSLRLSLGWTTTAEEIALAAEIIPRVWQRVAAAEPVALEAVG